MEMWNHFENYDDRTNNRPESGNKKMKLFCGAAQSDFGKAVYKYYNTKKSTARNQTRRPEVATNETKFNQPKDLFKDKVLSF